MKSLKKLEKFTSSKLEKSQYHAINGGCTCDTVSMCHMDGTTDVDNRDV